MVDSFNAVPSIRRFVLNVLDEAKYEQWCGSEDLDEPIPTIRKIFVGYEKGPGTPVIIQTEVDRVETEYASILPTPEVRAMMSENEYFDSLSRANMLLRRNLLLAVIKNLDIDSANVLAKEWDGAGYKLLVMLGWVIERPIVSTGDDETNLNLLNDEVEKPEEGEGVTGA